jgi:CHASE1-domain containing sensor protein
VLKGAAGLFAASITVERTEWRDYVDHIDIEERYQGIRALGFIERVPAGRLAEFIATNQLDGPKDFDNGPSGARDEYWVVKYVEPEAGNASVLGYDISTEARRAEAARLARDEGRPAITRRIQLVQTVEEAPAVLLLLPIYRPGSVPTAIWQRRASLMGWVFGAFLVDDLMDDLPESKDTAIDFEIFEENTNKISLQTWIYNADNSLHAINPGKCTFQRNVPIKVVDRTWSVHFNTRPAFDSATDYTESRRLLAGGKGISILLLGITRSLAATRQRAQKMAPQKTGKIPIQEPALIATSKRI